MLLLLPAVAAPLAVLVASRTGSPLVLPCLATLTVYPAMVLLLLRGRRIAAAIAVLLWAASLSASIVALSERDAGAAARVVLRGTEYRDEMFSFLRSGSGRESDPTRFLPQHALHLTAFVALAAASGGLLGIGLGAVLVGYMSFYVGALASAGCGGTAYVLGWPPWAILRVLGFILIGVALSRPLLSLLARREVAPGSWRAWYLLAGSLIVADALLKGLLAPLWPRLLAPCLLP